MGHQFYARLSGCEIELFRTELAQETPERSRAVDVASKAVFYRLVQLFLAGDLQWVYEFVSKVGVATNGSSEAEASLLVEAELLESVRRKCKYPDEAGRVALALLRDVGRLARAAEGFGACCGPGAAVIAAQIVRAEVIARLPRDGFLGTQAIAADLIVEVAARARESFIRQCPEAPDRRQTWRAPRARTPRRTQTETGAINVS